MFTVDDAAGRVGAETERREMPVDVAGLVKRYGRRAALDNLTVTVGSGDILGLVGGNGGGKTTALRILAGILRPDAGRGRVLGFDLLRGSADIRAHVGYMSQRLSLYAELTVDENLHFRAQVHGVGRPRFATEAAIADFELTPHRRSRAGRLSGGWARRLQLAAALIHSPRLLLLDEPTAGLDAVSRQDVWRRIAGLAARGVSVIVSTHDLAEAECCSRIALLSEGRVIATGPPDEVARRAPARAFVVYGNGARHLVGRVDTVPGVIATYPQGAGLRVVAEAEAEGPLASIATSHGSTLAPAAMRLEDAALAFARKRA